MTNWTYSPRRDVFSKFKRRMIQWRAAAPVTIAPKRPVVSVTFDDFPRSAVSGADIVEEHGGRAGFYACTDFVNKHGPYGEMFRPSDIPDLQARGHELGAHTHSHLNCESANPDDVMADLEQNTALLHDMGLEGDPTSVAYPYGEVSQEVKRRVASRYTIGRGVLAGLNLGTMDRVHLRAFELDNTQASVTRAHAAIAAAEASNAWVILFTHDVQKSPTDFGVRPVDLRDLCKHAQDIGADILPPTKAAGVSGVSKT